MDRDISARLEIALPLAEKTRLSRFARRLNVSPGVLLRWSFENGVGQIEAMVKEAMSEIEATTGEYLAQGWSESAWEHVGSSLEKRVDPEI